MAKGFIGSKDKLFDLDIIVEQEARQLVHPEFRFPDGIIFRIYHKIGAGCQVQSAEVAVLENGFLKICSGESAA